MPVSYLQLDPFWAPVDGCEQWNPNGTCGCAMLHFDERLDLYPSKLTGLVDDIGVKLLLYSDMYCPDTALFYPSIPFIVSRPYDIGLPTKTILSVIAMPMPVFAEQFYHTIMSKYVANGVLGGFEIDFMDIIFLMFDQYNQDVSSAELWVSGMNAAASKLKIPIQYCMTLPGFALQSVKLMAVTNARATEDNYPQNPNRWQLAYGSMLFAALGLKPFFDVIWTVPTQPPNIYNMSRHNILLQGMLKNGIQKQIVFILLN